MTTPTIYALHENPEWFPPFARAFEAEGVHVEEWLLTDGVLDLDSAPPEGVFWSRISASAHTRDHHLSKDYTRAVLSWLEAHGRRTVNGRRVLELEMSKVDQLTRLRAAGITILGKTNMDEFAMGSSTEHSAYGPTRNPWDVERVPGGSGGGSAAALAAFQAPLAIGSDTSGSIRQPAALTATVGVKPTYGTVSRYGLIACASSLDQGGPCASTVLDTALLHQVIAGHDPRDSTSVDAAVPDVVAAAVDGGARTVVLREKDLPDDERARLADTLRPLLQGGTLVVAGTRLRCSDDGPDAVHLAAAAIWLN